VTAGLEEVPVSVDDAERAQQVTVAELGERVALETQRRLQARAGARQRGGFDPLVDGAQR